MEEAQRIDRRIQRTRHELREALFALIIERGYEAITVLDITERANLGRTTFYLHYHEKEELLVDSVKELLNELRQGVEPEQAETCITTFAVFAFLSILRATIVCIMRYLEMRDRPELLLYVRRILPNSISGVCSRSCALVRVLRSSMICLQPMLPGH